MGSRLEDAMQQNFNADPALAKRLQGMPHVIQDTTYERSVASNFRQVQPMNALATGMSRALVDHETHSVTTNAKCPHCDNAPIAFLVRKAPGGYQATCTSKDCNIKAIKQL